MSYVPDRNLNILNFTTTPILLTLLFHPKWMPKVLIKAF